MRKQHSSYNNLINELADLCGIVPEYWDIFGKKHKTPLKTKKAILRAMKLNINSVKDIVKEITYRKRKPWQDIINPVIVISVNEQPVTVPFYIPVDAGDEAELTISWSIEQDDPPEGGPKEFPSQAGMFTFSGHDLTVLEEQWVDDRRYIRAELSDTNQRDIGYYRISIECRHAKHIFPGDKNLVQKQSRLIIAPDTCYIPPELQEEKTWGLSVNLYAIRSKGNWGIGDFSDLKRIVQWIGHLKGGFIGINPLHVLPNTKPYGISPYSPISRLYKNYIYLDVAHIPEVVNSENIQDVIRSERFSKALHALKTADLIDYEKIASLKEEILRMAFDYFYEAHYTRDTERSREFKQYISEQGSSLESFAAFMALYKHMKRSKNIYTWQEWDEIYHMLSNKAVQEFTEKHIREVLYHQYLQWLIDVQLEQVYQETKIQELPVGLYYDLAIGSIDGGSDAWSFHDIIAVDADVGAPPDDFSPNGQNWGFPPLNPENLRESAYELFIQTMRNNMKYGGALRIDHALGLFRIFWIPHGMSPREGTYVNFPAEDLLRIIALESMRNKTIVIAEDLGTIGENVRETLERFHMLSYRLFYFERNYPDPSFTPPENYPALALCAVTTHDLPTIFGYWTGQDLKVKQNLGMFPNEKLLRRQTKERERDKALILSALETQGILPHNAPPGSNTFARMTTDLCRAIYHYLALTPCKLLLVSLDDIIGTLNQQNMPGTLDEHPNWMQKTPLWLNELIQDRRFIDLAEMLKKTVYKKS